VIGYWQHCVAARGMLANWHSSIRKLDLKACRTRLLNVQSQLVEYQPMIIDKSTITLQVVVWALFVCDEIGVY